MTHFLLAGVGFVLWALYIILTYYSTSFSRINHAESTSGFGSYLLSLIIIYGVHKAYTVFFSPRKKIQITFWHLIGGFFLQFLVLCLVYTSSLTAGNFPISGKESISGMVLFFHSIELLLYPLFLLVLMRSFGFSILEKLIPTWTEEKRRIRVLGETSLGFFIFTIGLLVLGGLGYYTLTGLISLLGVIAVLSFSGLRETYRDIKTQKIEYENHTQGGLTEKVAPKLLTAEIAFITLSFLIGVSLINAIRPMPIGWDDLGVYMNFPKMMALSGETLLGAGMYTWQLITGTGFLFSYTAAQAFYVNQLGGILAVVAIIGAISALLDSPNKKYLISLPIISAAIFYAMPMNIFQQAKDMKLDPALLGVSIAAFMILFSLWKKDGNAKRNILFIGLAGLLAGFAFSIKVTSLMLFLAGFGLIAYRLLSFWGFLGFFFLFLAIFTGGNLWSLMNVWMPVDNNFLIRTIAVTLGVFGIFSLIMATKYTGKIALKQWFIASIVFLGGIMLGIAPWALKNTIEVQPWKSHKIETKTLFINSLLNGSGGSLGVDYTKLYPKEEIEKREKLSGETAITSSGQSQSEDLGRYFGYESGLNNYLKIPANLTFQKNQAGEFTDITFIYLALVPSLLLFIRGRKWIFAGVVAGTLSLLYLYWFTAFGDTTLTKIFGNYTLPLGYGILVLLNILFLTISHFLIEDEDNGKKIKEIIMVLGVYGFLFLISAFGIVWYGILIYFLFLVLISLSSSAFIGYTESDKKNEDLYGVKVTLTGIFFIFVATYFINSALPHGWNNLKDASYNEFKYNILNQEESIFAYRQDYITPITTMNIRDEEALINRVKGLAKTKELKEFFTDERLQNINAQEFTSVLFSLKNNKNQIIANDARNLGNQFYKSILYPAQYAPDLINTGGIYRIGTFMTYLISENRKRYYEDSLVFGFETYFYDQNPEKTIDRMKKLGLKYLLVDLNAATIDRDPRRALTTRFEHLLTTMKATNLRLADTDNICLRLALDEYKKGKLQNNEEFINIGGTNYESYRTQSGRTLSINRGEKQSNCYNYILRKLYQENGASEYPYLEPIKTAIDGAGALGDNDKLASIFGQYAGQSWFALFEIQEK